MIVKNSYYTIPHTCRQVQELSDQGVAMGQRQEMKQTRRTSTMKEQIRREQSKSKQLEMEMDCLKRLANTIDKSEFLEILYPIMQEGLAVYYGCGL